MALRLLALLLFNLIIGTGWVGAQKATSPFITNYSVEDYQASLSNWDIVVDEYGRVFIANLDGVLTFDSRKWGLNPTHSGVISIARDDDNRIYYGTSASDFGYLDTNSKGEIILSSLAQGENIKKAIGAVWGIVPCGSDVYFFSKAFIYKWDGKQIFTFAAKENPFNFNLQCLNDQIYLIREGVGLVRLVYDSLTAVEGTSGLSSDNLQSLWTNTHGETILGTSKSGFFYIEENNLVKKDWSENFSSIDAFKIHKFPGKEKVIISVLNNGLLITDFNQSHSINKADNLQSNSVKNTYIDGASNIWAAMQEGISFIEYQSPLKKVRTNGLEGTITRIMTFKDELFVGTTAGLYKKSKDTFKLFAGLESRVWDIQITPNKQQLCIATSEGVYKVDSSSATKLAPITFSHRIFFFNDHTIILHANGISIMDQQMKTSTIPLSDHTFVDLKIDSDENIWATTKFKGVYKIHGEDLKNPKLTLFTKKNGLPDVTEIHIIEFQNKLLFTTTKGLYQYKENNPDSSKFIPYQGALSPKGHIKLGQRDGLGNYYFTFREGQGDRVVKFKNLPNGNFDQEYNPFKRLPDMEITSIYPDKDSVTWIAGSKGLFSFNDKIKKDYSQPFNTVMSRVSIGDSLIFGGFYAEKTADNDVPYLTIDQPESYVPTLTFEDNNITFEFAATYYEAPEETRFSYILQNNDEKWSKWNTETKKEYTNLPAGEYNFMVKAKNVYDTEGRTASYRFTILPPWYQTNWAYAGFTILAILFVWFVSLLYTYRVRMQRRKLKLIVADRTFEVMSQKKEIESQNNLLKDQYEEISKQKDEIQVKNTELEQSQEEILTINDRLNELNHSLEKKVEDRTTRIKATLVQLKKANKELDTFVYRASHDLKGPISRIHGLTSLAKLEVSDGDTKYYDLIENAALDMQGLLSKLSHAYEIMNKTIDLETIDLPFLLSEIRNEIKFLDQGTQYAFDLQEKLTLKTDKYLFKIIITNLIENALIFRKQRNENHEVKISCHEDKQYFHFQIADNGIGISPDHTEKIYDMFFRGSDQSKGSGLGLYIVKLALDKIKGSITIDSTVYEYSSFTVKIPLGK